MLVDTNNLAALKISRGKSLATSKVVVDISLFNARGLACVAWLAKEHESWNSESNRNATWKKLSREAAVTAWHHFVVK